MFPAVTLTYLREQRFPHECCAGFLSLTTNYHDFCNFKMTQIYFLSVSINWKSGHQYSYLFFSLVLWEFLVSYNEKTHFPPLPSYTHSIHSYLFAFNTSRLIRIVQVVCMILHWNVVILSEIGDITEIKQVAGKTKFMMIAGLKIHFFLSHCWTTFLHLQSVFRSYLCVH